MHETELLTSLHRDEFGIFVETCEASPLYQAALAEFRLPEGFEVVIEPWPYGGMDDSDENRRYFQGLIFARDTRSGNQDSNFYAYPLPIIPVMDFHKREIIRIDRLATGGKGDPLTQSEYRANIIDHCKPAEYIPELLEKGTRKDLKPLNIVQPDGPSFKVTDESLVEWQKWRFRVGFNPREGATIHDVRYDGRSVMYRLSISEMASIKKSWLVLGSGLTEVRLFRMRMLGRRSIESRHSTLETVAQETMRITSHWDVTASALSRQGHPQVYCAES